MLPRVVDLLFDRTHKKKKLNMKSKLQHDISKFLNINR